MDIAIPLDMGISPGSVAEPGGNVGASYGASLTSDVAAFDTSLKSAGVEALEPVSPVTKALFSPLEHINAEAASLSQQAELAAASGSKMTQGEVVMLSVKSHEFMFQAQLTSNIANRASEGVQQLFRQQG